MTIVADPRSRALARQEIVALAIHNARCARVRSPTVEAIDRIPEPLRSGRMDEAAAALAALRTAGFDV